MVAENAARTAENEGQNAPGTSDTPQQAPAKRERSSIGFPYNPLADAIEVAKAIHDHVGAGDCEDSQLAAWLNQSAKSSGYRMQLTAARMFGVLGSGERRALTALGQSIVDPRQERAAKAEAFLRIPLYAAIYEKHKDGVLPPDKALETEIVGLGVAEKQKVRSRQVFKLSAQQAGYFEHGNNRLVRPGVAPVEAGAGEEKGKGGGGGSGGGDGGGPRHRLIVGLFESLPPDGGKWTAEEAADWLETAAANLRLVYKFKGRIKVEIESALPISNQYRRGRNRHMTDAEWIADKEHKRDAAERERAATTDPKKERSLRAKRDNYKKMLTLGREGMREQARRAAASR